MGPQLVRIRHPPEHRRQKQRHPTRVAALGGGRGCCCCCRGRTSCRFPAVTAAAAAAAATTAAAAACAILVALSPLWGCMPSLKPARVFLARQAWQRGKLGLSILLCFLQHQVKHLPHECRGDLVGLDRYAQPLHLQNLGCSDLGMLLAAGRVQAGAHPCPARCGDAKQSRKQSKPQHRVGSNPVN